MVFGFLLWSSLAFERGRRMTQLRESWAFLMCKPCSLRCLVWVKQETRRVTGMVKIVLC